MKLTQWDAAKYLDTRKRCAEYLWAVRHEPDLVPIARANVERAKVMWRLCKGA
jgi:DNA-binding phage protein